MHLGDLDVGKVPAIAIVGGGNTVVTGVGLAFQLRREDRVVVCFFGEGASSEGAFHEGLNFAAVRGLPIVFVCENNLYGASTPFGSVWLVENVADRAAAYGVPGPVVDGMDVLAVREAAEEAVAAHARAQGPHCSSARRIASWAQSQRCARLPLREEEAAWQAKDPLIRLRAELPEDAATRSTQRGRGARGRGRVRALLSRPRSYGAGCRCLRLTRPCGG